MPAKTLFNTSFSKTLRRDSVVNFHRSLQAKKTHLQSARNEYEKAAQIIADEEAKIIRAETELGRHELQSKKSALEAYIQTNRATIMPYVTNLASLAANIQDLENEIQDLEKIAVANPLPVSR